MAVVAVPPCPGGGGVTYLLAGLNFDPPIAGEVPPFTTGLDDSPDEGPTDYLMLFDVTNFDPKYATTCVPPTALPIPLGNSNQGTIVSIAIHPDKDVAYVVSSNFGTFYQNEEEDAWLYAVDLCQKIVVSAINLTAAQPTGLGLPNPTAEKIVAVHNGNLSANKDRLYIGTGPGGANNTADGHMLVFDISGTNKLVPALLKDVDLTPHDTNNSTALHLGGLVAVPGNSTFLGGGANGLKRNVILGVGTDYDPTVNDRFVVFEDR